MMTKDAVKVGHGHAYNAMMQGWMNPDLDYVAMGENGSELDRESVGTMFHAAQTLTGTITHNPIFSDGKRVLHGQKQGIELLMKKSDTAANLLEQIALVLLMLTPRTPDNLLMTSRQWANGSLTTRRVQGSLRQDEERNESDDTPSPKSQRSWTLELQNQDGEGRQQVSINSHR